jgi:hypothetical protein
MEKNTLRKPEAHPLQRRIRSLKIGEIELAYHVGISQSQLNRMLRGYRAMPENLEKAIDEALKNEVIKKK